MEYVIRNESVVTGKENLEQLYTFRDFPVFFGCVEHGHERDLKADMSWAICPESGVIQLDKLIPLDILYQEQHVDGTGPTWEQYYHDFADYIKKQPSKDILEIGGGAGKLADIFTGITEGTSWTLVEPNPLHPGNDRVKIKRSFFDESFKYEGGVDTVVFSQVMEHAYDPNQFVESIAKFLKPGQKLICAYPNLKLWLENKYTNAINFEHTMFLTDYFVDYLFRKHGFRIADKYFYKDHSVFYTVEKLSTPETGVSFENKYQEYRKIFNNYIEYYTGLVAELNKKIDAFGGGEVYVFGAHIFAQYLFEFGLKKEKIVALLDNSSLKQGRRLYGTPFMVQNPKALRGKGKVGVVLKVGIYRDEILKQLQEINSEVVIFE
ncbi:MAG: methyltransferase domain-containing protein [Candidatus Moraniibacteriota bacterium]|nr:MAG: methyltransferase domain-containing protein [Candidatus Moranbacteria bacterium]